MRKTSMHTSQPQHSSMPSSQAFINTFNDIFHKDVQGKARMKQREADQRGNLNGNRAPISTPSVTSSFMNILDDESMWNLHGDDTGGQTTKEELQEKTSVLEKSLNKKEEDVGSLTKLLLKEKKNNDELQRENEELQNKIRAFKKNPSNNDEDVGVLTKMLLNERKNNNEIERQKEELHKKNTQLKKLLDAKRNLEPENNIEDLELMNQTLLVKERLSNDELQDARQELIKGLKDNPRGRTIGVKRMGDLDNGPFLRAMKKKYNLVEARARATEECSLWEDYLRDPNWQPFKVVTINGEHEEVINPEDEKLMDVEEELGSEVHSVIVSALMEINEYNPSGRYPTPELWNYIEGRKATLKEGVSYILKLDKQKRRK